MGKGSKRDAINEAIKLFTEPVTATTVAEKAREICGEEIVPTAAGYYLRQNNSVECIEILERTKTIRLYVMKSGYIDFNRNQR